MHKVKDSTSTHGTCPKNFSNPLDQDICTQCALSWKIAIPVWRLVIAVSMNVRSGVRHSKSAKLYMCMQKHNKDRHTATGVHGHGSVPMIFLWYAYNITLFSERKNKRFIRTGIRINTVFAVTLIWIEILQ